MARKVKKEKISSGKTVFRSDIARAVGKKLGINLSDMETVLDEVFSFIGQCAINKDTVKLAHFGNFENVEYFATKTRYGENKEKITTKEKVCKYVFTIADKIDDIKNRPHLTEQRYGVNCDGYIHWKPEQEE